MENWDVVVCGGGAAGLTAGLYAARAGKRCLILDRGASQMIYAAQIENMPGCASAPDGFTLWSAMQRQAVSAGAVYRTEEILSFDLTARLVTTDKAVYRGARIVLCLGRSAKGLSLPGEKALIGHGISFCALCDGGFYRHGAVAVIGGGETAFHDAWYLAGLGADVTLIHRRKVFTAEPDRVRRVGECAALVTPYRAAAYLTDRFPDGIREDTETPGRLTGVRIVHTETGETKTIRADGIFLAVGQTPNTRFAGLRPILDTNGYVITDAAGKTAVPHICAAGDVRAAAFCQILAACASGAVSVQ